MSETVLVALMALFGTLIGSFAGILTANKLLNYRVERLEKQMDKSNGMHVDTVDRVYKLEQRGAVVDEEIKVINHRIGDLEQYHK